MPRKTVAAETPVLDDAAKLRVAGYVVNDDGSDLPTDAVAALRASEAAAAKPDDAAAAGETKAAAFKRIGSRRLGNAVNEIRKLGNLVSPAYEYTPEQLVKIMLILRNSLDELQETFDGKKAVGNNFDL